MFFSFGFFEAEEENQATLTEFHRVLRPGGKVIIETDVNPDLIAAGTYGDRELRTLADGMKLSVREEYDVVRGRLNGSWEILSSEMQKIDGRFYSVRIYSHEELKAMFNKAGFLDFEVRSFPDLSANVSTAPEIAYLAIK